MTRKAKSWLAVVLFFLVFGGLLLTATFTDLRISQILTENVLPPNQYYTNHAFGAVFECIGSTPIYFMIAFCMQIFVWYALRFLKNTPGKAVSVSLGMIGSFAACYALFDDTVGNYLLRHLHAEKMKGEGFVTGVILFLALVLTFFATLAVRNFSDLSVKRLVRFAWAMLATALVATLLVHFLKGPFGRMRYRAMNTAGGASVGGLENFTRWYVVNGRQKFSDEEMILLFGTADACRSFPSGHTGAAGMSYGLIMLIDVLDIRDRWKKAVLWLLPLAFTGAVAVSRIMVGAHFFSDVLVGGTTSFVFMILFRELIVCRCANLKAMFKRAPAQ